MSHIYLFFGVEHYLERGSKPLKINDMNFIKMMEPMQAQAFSQFFNRPQTSDEKKVLTNIYSDEAGFNLELALPGYQRENFNVSAEDQFLIIKATAENQEIEDENFLRKEFSVSSFERRYSMPKKVDADAINASYQNGILTIKLPFKPEVVIKREVAVS